MLNHRFNIMNIMRSCVNEKGLRMELQTIQSVCTLSIRGRFTEPFGKDPKNLYCYFIFEGGKVMLKAPQNYTPNQRVIAVFEASFDFSVLQNGRSLESFRPQRFLASEPCK